jgi:hypothetical protein
VNIGDTLAQRVVDAAIGIREKLYRGESATGELTMTVRTEHWQRELTVAFWSQGEKKSLMRILAPSKEKGTATLRVENDIWNFLPKVKRVIKVPSSMMGGSWMGSHFTNDDLVRMSRMADDYTFAITFEGQRGGEAVIEITCTPRDDAVVVWGKIVAEVRPDGLPLRMRYFNEDLELARTMVFADIKTLGGRTLPTRMTITPADKPKEATTVVYNQLHLGAAVADDTFSLRALQR